MSFGAAILGCAGTRLTLPERRFFQQADPFGFILFARNVDSAGQVGALCDALRDAVGRDAPILIDQEGGRVQRLVPPVARQWLPPLEQVQRAGRNAARVMYLRYRVIAHELLALGIDVNCAPVLDIARRDTHPFLHNRCYGSDLKTVVAIGQAVAGGLLDGGVLPVVKHMPGHGLAQLDSHLSLPRVSEAAGVLESTDFAAFRALGDLPMGMTAHLVYDAFDALPATVSGRMIDVIRDDIGFDGLLMSDDISMEALGGAVWDKAAAARAAGCDAVLHCNGDLPQMERVADACGAMDGAAQERAGAALAGRRTPMPADMGALMAEIEALKDG